MPHLLTVAEALWRDRVVEVRYRRWSPSPGVVTRRLEPLGLVLKAGVWYLVAGVERPRTYRVSSIVEATALDDEATRPAGFDLAAWWQEHVEEYERADTAPTAVVRMSPEALKAFQDVPRAVTPPDEDGWHRVTIPLDNLAHTATGLLRLGPGAQVVAPPELVEHMTATIHAMARLYPERKSGGGGI